MSFPTKIGLATDSEGHPVHRAEELTGDGEQARITLGDQIYTLRITRAGKLILTK